MLGQLFCFVVNRNQKAIPMNVLDLKKAGLCGTSTDFRFVILHQLLLHLLLLLLQSSPCIYS